MLAVEAAAAVDSGGGSACPDGAHEGSARVGGDGTYAPGGANSAAGKASVFGADVCCADVSCADVSCASRVGSVAGALAEHSDAGSAGRGGGGGGGTEPGATGGGGATEGGTGGGGRP